MNFHAGIFDIDGVIADTAPLHERAWRSLFEEVLEAHDRPPRFTHEDYREHVDGKPRLDGLRDFLASRELELSDDESERLGDRKNELFHELLQTEEIVVYPDAVRTIRDWRDHGLGIAFVSSSRNAMRILEQVQLDALCDVRVDGNVAAQLELDGKPEILREAARRLRVRPERAVVVEDAEAGVRAAREEGFGLVVGLARDGGGDRLSEQGAQTVVTDLGRLQDVTEPGTRRASELPCALNVELVDAALGHRRPVVFLDYDGTLTPIVDDPDDAVLSEEVREVVRSLAELCTVGVVSGRDRDDVEERVGIDGLWYLGCHGFDSRAPGGEVEEVDEACAALPELERIEADWRERLDGKDGISLERKRFMVGLHYRQGGEQAARRCHEAAQQAAEHCDHLRVHRGRQVVELWPNVPWDKGRAIERLLDHIDVHGARSLPVYVGDGHTDEDAFRSLTHIGLPIIVGDPRRPTHAELRLADPDEVKAFLEGLTGRLRGRSDLGAWQLAWSDYAPEQERLREALTTLGNGVFATRGAAEWASADEHHYPGTYVAGGYDHISTQLRGRVLTHEDLVNFPNWLCLTFRGDGGRWLDIDRMELLDHHQELDVRRGILSRTLRVRDDEGRTTRLHSERLVSMRDPNVASIRWRLVPEDWSGTLEIRSALDGTVRNTGVARYGELRGDHLVTETAGQQDDDMWLSVHTQQSRIRMGQAARTRVVRGAEELPRRHELFEGRVDQALRVTAEEGEEIEVHKTVVLHTSRDPALSEPLRDARTRLEHLPSHDALQTEHERRWAHLWRRADIRLSSHDDEALRTAQRILRVHMFHLLQVASPHIVDRDVGVPARGLHGEAYRGKIFWDELFIFPFLDYSIPALTRELLLYRYRRLDQARRRARERGLMGAMYPWQSGASGEEENPSLHLNPESGRWIPDETHLQRHIDAAIAYNVWQHYEITGDDDFLAEYGAEMLVEIARFWASIARWDEDLQQYRICGVVGPDEFHTAYPDTDRSGLDDNAYTNVMAAWCLRTAERALSELTDERRMELLDELSLSDADRRAWRHIASALRVPLLADEPHVIAQFDGWDELQELDWEHYRAEYGDIQRMDRILESEGDSTNRYKLSKQADVLMLLYLFSADELVELLSSMGVTFEAEWIPENVEYYSSRTSHGSTLSRVVHSWVLARADRKRSWSLLEQALKSDVEDIQGGTTSEGIHLGAMAGTVDLVQRCYTGAVIRDGVLWLEPQLPEELGELQLRFRVRCAWLEVRLSRAELDVSFVDGSVECARIGFGEHVHELRRGESRTFHLDDGTWSSA